MFSIQNKWDISFTFGMNQLIKYKINTSKWLLNLTDSMFGNYSEILEVIGTSIFKLESSRQSEQQGLPPREKEVSVPLAYEGCLPMPAAYL